MADTLSPAALAGRILNKIETHPENFDMGSWYSTASPSAPLLLPEVDPECGTTLCAAGWAAHLGGYTLIVDGGAYLDPAHVLSVPVAARALLGLTDEQANDLFYASATGAVGKLRQLAGGKGYGELLGSDDDA